MSDDVKIVNSYSSPKSDRVRYALQGSGTNLAGYKWVLSGRTTISGHDDLEIVASGYRGSFERKLKERGGGLVTGNLSVFAFWDHLIPGWHQRIVRNTYFGTYGGEGTSFFPHITPPAPPSSPTVAATNAALARLLKKYLDNRKVLAAVIAAEFGSSIDSVKQGFSAALDLYRSSHKCAVVLSQRGAPPHLP